jgi:hypothetical protein
MAIDIIVGFTGVILTIILSSISLAYWLGKKFEGVEARFKLIDERFITINERFKHIEERFTQIDERFKAIDERFKIIDDRFNRVEERLNHIEKRLDSLENRFHSLENRFSMFSEYVRAIYFTLVDFMTLKGLFTESERLYLIRELDKFTKLYETPPLNPLKPEELKFIKEVIQELKEKPVKEIELWKLEKLVEIADRLTREEPSRLSAEFLVKAYMLYSIIRSEKIREEEKARKHSSIISPPS